MRLLFRTHAVSLAFVGVVEARLLRDLAAAFDDLDLALDFVVHRVADEAEGVHVLDFGLGAELLLSDRPTLTLASQRSEPSSMLQSLTPV